MDFEKKLKIISHTNIKVNSLAHRGTKRHFLALRGTFWHSHGVIFYNCIKWMRTKAGEGALSETTVLFPTLVKMSLDNVRLISYTMVRRDCHGRK